MLLKKTKNNKTGRTYLSVVESYRDKDTNKSKKRTIKSFGYYDELIKLHNDPIEYCKSEIEKLFGKFVMIDQNIETFSTLERGSGLGLYITKGIIEAHGGRIWVESKGKNLGAEFYFTIPK